MTSITRDMEQYIAVEKFEQYELTSCMAYEFAIRNKDANETINVFLNEYYNDKIIEDMVICIKDIAPSGDKAALGGKIWEIFSHKIEIEKKYSNILRSEYHIIIQKLYLNYHFFHEVEEKINRVLKSLKELNSYGESFGPMFISSPLFETRDIIDELIDIPETNDDKAFTSESWDFIKSASFYESVVSYIRNEDNDTDVEVSKIENSIAPRYARPSLYVAEEISREIDVKLNLALPEKDLIDFIKKLKREKYNASPTLYDYLDKESAIYKDRELGSRSVLTNQYKLAELLFIYDATQIGMSIAEIQQEIWRYESNTKASFRDKDTIESRLKTAKDYIENMRYKELLAEYSLDES